MAVLCKAGHPVAGFHGKARKAHQSRKECAGGRGPSLAEKFTPGALFRPAWAVGDAATRNCQEDAVPVMVAGRDGQPGPGPQGDGVG